MCNIPDAFGILFRDGGVKHGRLTLAIKALAKRKIQVEPHAFVCGEKRIPCGWGWESVKKGIREHLAADAMSNLIARRPGTFGGGGKVHRVQHMKLLQSLPNYDAAIMMRIWTGSLLTRERAYRVRGAEHQKCTCGMEQTVWHVLCECPDLPLVPPELTQIARSSPSLSVALLLPDPSPPELVDAWKKACARARHLLSLLSVQENAAKRARRIQHDPKGHMVITDASGRYSYCCRCFISRRIRDRAWIFQAKCPKQGPGFVEGQQNEIDGHVCVCALKLALERISSQTFVVLPCL